MNEGRIIYNPGKLVLEMFYRKMNKESRDELQNRRFEAVGLVQTSVASVLYYADRVAKTSNVLPVEINGSCPQHITTLAFFGDTSAVETAMKMVACELNSKASRIF